MVKRRFRYYPDYYVVTNYEELKEGVNQNQMFKITYELTPAQIRSVNGGYTDENGYYRYVGDDTVNTNDDQKYYQANIPVKIMVDRNDDGDYADENETDYTKNLDARAYIRYYDANGKLRVFYNNYSGNRNYGGCMCSFIQVSSMALKSSAAN